MLFGGFLDTDLTNMCFSVDTSTFEISRMDCFMRKNKKFIKYKDFVRRVDNEIFIIDDDNEIHQYSIEKNEWKIVETIPEFDPSL